MEEEKKADTASKKAGSVSNPVSQIESGKWEDKTDIKSEIPELSRMKPKVPKVEIESGFWEDKTAIDPPSK